MGELHVRRPVRVLIVDDHPVVREGTRALLAQSPELRVVGVVGEGLAAIRMVGQLRPDVLLLDVRLPDISGVEVARRLLVDWPDLAILVITGYDDIGYTRALLALGIRGYLAKSASGAEILAAIRAVAAGKMVLAPGAALELAGGPDASFTTREREVLQLLAAGRRNAQIAEQLSVSLKTVEYHVHNVLDKLGAHSRAEAVSLALRRGDYLGLPSESVGQL